LSIVAAAAAALVLSTPIVSTASGYDPSTDAYSMASVTSDIGATSWWDAGYTGAGIDVAVIDTGVTPVPALSGSGKVVYGPDLSLTSQVPALSNLDAYGHGTFMAGLIAGHDQSLSSPYSAAPASAYRGIAPDARIISVKVGASDGEVDVSQVIAAIDWVVQHAEDPGFNIRVISLSYGTNSTQSYVLDPLAYAAEQAWKHGVVVVAAAGNTGFQRGHNAPGLADPAYDPYIIGVGGVDTMGTASPADDTVGDYSAGANTGNAKAPDFVAAGSHLQGLRVPGSYIDDSAPSGILDDQYMRGSGTSEATAVTAGAVALILQRYPNLTPDQVKQFIQADAQNVHGKSRVQGAGELDLTAMLTDTPPGAGPAVVSSSKGAKGGKKSAYVAPQYTDATGMGSLEAARGSDHLSLNGDALVGEIDIFGHPFSSAAIAAAESTETSWSGDVWNGNTWSGNTWSGNTWSGNTWSGNTWSGNTWSGNTWSGNTWSGNTWSGNTWSGNTWSSSDWASSGWD
jgi:serine protease AprX